jgi:hypothetical protein
MGFLDSLSQGLRGAGAIFDEGVYKTQRVEEAQIRNLDERRKDLMAQTLIRAGESGAAPPEVVKAGLERLGYKGLEVGPDAQTQQRQDEIKRRDAISRSLGGLTPEDRQDPVKVAGVFLENGDHATGARYIDLAEQRNARKEQALMALTQRASEMEQRAQDRAADRASREQAQRDALALRAQIAQGQQMLQRDSLALRATIAQGNQDIRREMGGGGKPPTGYRFKPDGSLEAIPGGPGDVKAQKLPAELQRMTIGLNALEAGLTAYEDLLKDFNPRSVDQLDMTKRAKIDSLVADLRMQAKEAQALGALTGPDGAILDKALAEPTGRKGVLYGGAGLREQIKETREAIKRRREGMASLNKPPAATDGWSIKEKK